MSACERVLYLQINSDIVRLFLIIRASYIKLTIRLARLANWDLNSPAWLVYILIVYKRALHLRCPETKEDLLWANFLERMGSDTGYQIKEYV